MFLEIVSATLVATQTIYGVAIAADGDSLSIGNTRVRLFGIDAPEFDQTCKRGSTDWSCGREAADHLSSLVTGKEVRCVPVSTDQYGREVSRCSVGALDVGRDMVATGYAVAYRHYSLDYVGAEESAKADRRGLWSGTFTMPSELRAERRSGRPTRQQRSVAARPHAAGGSGTCLIKGNHSRRGELIYHLPGMPYYEQTRPEAIFCTEPQAQAAGYRRAIVR